jgi:hypothetical protein
MFIYYCVIDSIRTLGRRAFRLWGLTLLFEILSVLAVCLGALPIISLPIIFVLSLGMFKVFYEGYLGNNFTSEQLFCCFKGGFLRNCCGLAWMYLWILLWALIPFVGVFFAVYKSYSYRFVPYILLTRPEVSATEALRLSIKETRGYKGTMFGADILVILAVFLVILILALFCQLPLIGWLFTAVLFLTMIACSAFLPLLFGLLGAAYYCETHGIPESETPSKLTTDANEGENTGKQKHCPDCGELLVEGHIFCGNCGYKINSLT